jgi:hypothetical protein
MTKLARRAVACPGWRWLPGMLIKTVGGPTDRIAGIDSTYIHAWAESQQTENPRGMWIRYRLDRMNKHGVPDLSDPATVGCLLALVREAWGNPLICTAVDNTGCGWWVEGGTEESRVPWHLHDTEAAALVAALEAAP